MKNIIDTLKILGESICVGKRFKYNLTALTAVSVFIALLGLVMIVFDSVIGQYLLHIPSITTLR